MKKFRKLSEELTPSSTPEPGREAMGGRFQSGAPKRASKPAPQVTAEEIVSEIVVPHVKQDINTLDKTSFVKKHGITKSAAREKVTEAKDEKEYGYEGDMALNQLKTLVRCAEMIEEMLKPDTDLPEWVQSKITLATDYIQTAADYMYSELKEGKDVGDDPTGIQSPSNLTVKKGKTVASGPVTEGHRVVATTKQGETFKSGIHPTKEKAMSQHYKMAKSGNFKKIDTVKVNESFAETMAHKEKANAAKESGDTHAFHGHMVDHHVSMANFHKEHGDDKSAKEHEEKAKEHHSNMERYYREDVEHIDEKISIVQGQAPRQQGRFAPNNQIRTDKTSIGRVVSGTQYTGTRKPKPVKEEIVQEGRPSQRHPLEGHEYHKKSDEALVHIAKDAHAAAEAMKGHNTTAENKYRDQANDSATVRHYRKTHGMQPWYKKKYGHMNEQKVDNEVPFDGPYTTRPSTVTDKSGASHTPMSRARDLARKAAQRQAGKMPVKPTMEESRKAEIVKEIMKKGKKKEDNSFQAEPELGTTVVKADN